MGSTPKGGTSFTAKLAELKAQKEAAASGATVVVEAEAPEQIQEVPTPATQPTLARPVLPPPTGTAAERLAALKARSAHLQLVPATAAAVEQKDEGRPEDGNVHVPQVLDGDSVVLSAEEMALDGEIKAIGIIEAYNRWVGKGHVDAATYRNEGKVRCPNPAHPDNDPSAWMNKDKQLWHCGSCAMGGDNWDFAAWHYGYPVPGYKKDPAGFRELREKIAGELGYSKYTTSAGTFLSRTPPTVDPDPQENDEAATEDEPPPSVAKSNVVQLHIVEDQDYAESVGPVVASINWRRLVTPNTFLWAWMAETTKDTCPEEFHFWTGLMALGYGVGRNRVLLDNPKVVPNIFVCLTGPSGTGKSRAKAHLKQVLSRALPFDHNDPLPMGTKLGGTPGSGEVLVDMFVHKIEDPSAPAAPQKDWPIRVYLEFDEMASLVSRGSRAGSSLKPQLMEVYDAPHSISAASRGAGHAIAMQPFGQVMTTTQNKSIRGVVGEKDDAAGFINRWVFVTGPRKKQKAINAYITNYDEPVKYLKGVHNWAMTPKDVTFEPAALVAFESFYEEVFALKDKTEESTAIFNRIDLLLKKLVLLLAINERTELITEEHITKLRALYPYLLETYGVVRTAMMATEADELEDKIYHAVVRYYDRKKSGITMNYLKKLIKGVESELMLKTINHMVKFEMLILEEQPGGTRGRPSMLGGKLLPGKAA
jgi:hypothetical protein